MVGQDRGVPSRPSEENLLRGDFGEAWLEVSASGCGILHGRPATLDLEKADVQLTLRGLVASTYNPTVKAQVKTTLSARYNEEDDVVYDLDVETYDVLRRTDHSVRRVLLVIALPAEGDLVQLAEQGTLLRGRAGWVSLEGAPATANTTSTAVVVPRGNTVDQAGLMALLTTFGTRASTPVPEVDEWEGRA